MSKSTVVFTNHINTSLAHIDTSTPPSPRLQHRTRSRPPRRHTSRSESHATYTTPETSLDVTQSLTAAAIGHRRTLAAQESQMKKTKSLDHQLSSEAKDYESIEQIDFDSRETLGVQDSIRSADTSNGHITGHVTSRVTESYVKAVLGEPDLQSADTSYGHKSVHMTDRTTTDHVTSRVTESYVKAVLGEPDLQSADTSYGHKSMHMTGHTTDHVTDHAMLRKDSYNQAMLVEQGLLHQQQKRVSTDHGDAVGMGDVDPNMGMRQYQHDTELLPVCKSIFL